MADPAWGPLSVSDEEIARALCSFQQVQPPADEPTASPDQFVQQQQQDLQSFVGQQQRQQDAIASYRQQLECHRPSAPNGNAFRAARTTRGQTDDTFHMVPMATRSTAEMAWQFAGLRAPTTSSDDWLRQQQRQLQEQRQRQLLHQHQQEQQRQQSVGFEQQQQYPPSDNFEQAMWSNDVHASVAASQVNANFGTDDGDQSSPQRGPQRAFSPFYSGSLQIAAQQTSLGPTSVAAALPAYVPNFGGPPQANRNGRGVMFAPEELAVDPVYQTHGSLPMGSQHPWAMEMEMARAAPSQPQSVQGGMQQQCFPVEAFEHGQQEVAALANASTPDEAFLDSLSAYPRSATSGGAENGGFQRNSGAAITQLQAQAQSPLPIPPIRPSRVVVIPGMSLTASTRVVRMCDILNYDNPGATKAGAKRLQGRKHQRAPPKPKAPRKKSPVKRQKKQPEQQPQRRPSLTNLHSSAPSTQSVDTAVFRSHPPTRGFDPTRFAFMESQATRELQQAASAATPKPSIPPIPVVPRHSLQTTAPSPPSKRKPAAAVGSFQRTVVSAPTQPKKRGPYKKKTKKEDAPPVPNVPPTGAQFTIKGPVQPDTNPIVALSSVDRSTTTMAVSVSTPRPAPKAQGQGPIPRNVSTAMQIVGVLAIPNGHYRMENYHPIAAMGSGGVQQQRWQDPGLVAPNKKMKAQLPVGRRQGGAALRPPGLLPVNGVTQGAGAAPKRKSKAKLPRSQLNPGAAIGAQAATQQQPAGRAALLTTASSTAADAAIVSTAAAPAVSKQAHVENRTVVIFCKRDFMRYQAAKIWRKYQEQLKKQEEWREVRVAGKRTRYLNSKYDDEIRKAHTRSHKKVERPRKLAASLRLAQESEESGSDKIPATSSPVEAANARSTGIDNTGSSQSEEQAFTLPSVPAVQDGSNDSTSGALPGMTDACSTTTGIGVGSKTAEQVGALAIAAESGNSSIITAGIYALSGEINADATTERAQNEVASRPLEQQLGGSISVGMTTTPTIVEASTEHSTESGNGCQTEDQISTTAAIQDSSNSTMLVMPSTVETSTYPSTEKGGSFQASMRTSMSTNAVDLSTSSMIAKDESSNGKSASTAEINTNGLATSLIPEKAVDDTAESRAGGGEHLRVENEQLSGKGAALPFPAIANATPAASETRQAWTDPMAIVREYTI